MRNSGIIRLIVGVVVLVLVGVVGGAYAFRPRPHYVEQPVKFNHLLHHQELDMECSFCHLYVQDYALAGMPKLETCMFCHDEANSPGNPQLVSLIKKANQEGENFAGVKWVRMYKNPGHVIFSHRVHLRQRIECATCHGPTGDSKKPVSADYLITMGQCISCHEARQVSNDCLTCHK